MNEVTLPPPGVYVIAVSGGVDSMVLLDIVRQQPTIKAHVAHLNHGIRPASEHEADRSLVEQYCNEHDIPLRIRHAHLGPDASEADARRVRLSFLRGEQKRLQAHGIMTAHHHNDVVETGAVNILRGTGRRGASSLKETNELYRPLLRVPKQSIVDYALSHNVPWREDVTNNDTRYLRNRTRHALDRAQGHQQRDQLVAHLQEVTRLNTEIEGMLRALVKIVYNTHEKKVSRELFRQLPVEVQLELSRELLDALPYGEVPINKNVVLRLSDFMANATSNKKCDLGKYWYAHSSRDAVQFRQILSPNVGEKSA